MGNFEDHASSMQRCANSRESIVRIECSSRISADCLYLLSVFKVQSWSVTFTQLSEKIQSDLQRLRFQHPEIATAAL
jgi:hypothetical protein